MSTLSPEQFGEKSIKTRSMPNVETERLHARLEGLRSMMSDVGGWADQKGDFTDRVRETVNVERELTRRGEAFKPVTDAKHLSISVDKIPVVNPRPARDREGMIPRPKE